MKLGDAVNPQRSPTASRPPAPVRRSLPPGLRFAWATGIGLFGVLLFGWLTGLRGVMHSLLVAIGATALAPFSLLLAGVAVVAAISLASALIADDASLPGSNARAKNEGRWALAYRTHLARQRQSPLAWGFAVGGALGVVGVWLVLAALVTPLETRTLGILRLAEARLSSSTAADSLVASDGTLRADLYAKADANPSGVAGAAAGEPLLDAFGHPVAHQTGAAASEFTLRSLGLDGVPSGDDLCASGRSGASPALIGDRLRFVEDLRADRLGWSALFSAIADARCR